MAITEETRHHLHQRLEKVLGSKEATTLMEHLPAVGMADLATTRQLDHLQAVTTRDLNVLGQQLRVEIAGLRTEVKTDIAGLRTEVKTDIAELRTEVKTDIAELRTETTAGFAALRTELHDDRRASQRQLIGALVVALIAVLVTVAGIG